MKTDEKPAWLELPDAQIEPEEVQLWSCEGKDKPVSFLKKLFHKNLAPSNFWRSLYPSKEEAEASAAVPSDLWQWNGEQAQPETLASALFRARRNGNAGVVIYGYRNGAWRIIRAFPCGVPLNEEER